jgi:hypothetical protein
VPVVGREDESGAEVQDLDPQDGADGSATHHKAGAQDLHTQDGADGLATHHDAGAQGPRLVAGGFKGGVVGIKRERNHLLGLSSKRALTRLTHIGLEDFFLASQFPDFLAPQVGGFINNTLRRLLQRTTNYIHIMPLSTGGPPEDPRAGGHHWKRILTLDSSRAATSGHVQGPLGPCDLRRSMDRLRLAAIDYVEVL